MSDDVNYTVIVANKAAHMLITHASFLAKASQAAADKLITSFDEVSKSLAFMPQRNPWFNYTSLPFNKYRKLFFSNRYVLIYQIKDTIVYIDYILDCRQDYVWLLK